MSNTKMLQMAAVDSHVDEFRRGFPVADIGVVERDVALTKKKMEAMQTKMKKVSYS